MPKKHGVLTYEVAGKSHLIVQKKGSCQEIDIDSSLEIPWSCVVEAVQISLQNLLLSICVHQN